MGVGGKLAAGLGALKGKGAAGILCGTFLTKAAAFLGSIILVRVMSKQDYGVLSSLENIYTYVYLLAGFGLNNAVFRWLVLKDSAEERKGVFLGVFAFGTAFNVALVAVALGVACVLPDGGASGAAFWMLPAMLLAIPFQFAYETGAFSFRALLMNGAFAVVSIVAVVLVWSSKVILASSFGLEGAVFSWPIAYAAMAAVVLVAFLFGVFRGVKADFVRADETRSMLAYSAQYMVTNGMWALFMQNDIFMIGQITGSAESVADYKVASVFPMVLALVSGSIGMFVGPYFIKHEKDHAWVWRNYKRVLVASVVSVGVLALLMSVFAKPLVLMVYGSQYENTVSLMIALLVGAFLNNGVRYASASLIAAMGRIRVNMVVAACGIVAQILLNFMLIPSMGPYGAAVGGIVAQACMAIAVTVYFVKTYRP